MSLLEINNLHVRFKAGHGHEVCAVNAVTAAFTVDNRIADGIYAGRALKLFKDFVENPEKLETPPHWDGSPAEIRPGESP